MTYGYYVTVGINNFFEWRGTARSEFVLFTFLSGFFQRSVNPRHSGYLQHVNFGHYFEPDNIQADDKIMDDKEHGDN